MIASAYNTIINRLVEMADEHRLNESDERFVRNCWHTMTGDGELTPKQLEIISGIYERNVVEAGG